ncbi:flavodoxin family protein [Candidatus Entotheonella palauensis]|nr:flavodoxin family protein [Candidatus Entotheonella palauensis]
MMGKQVVGIMGSYRKGGAIDTVVSEILNAAQDQGAGITKIDLVDKHIAYCTNCRACCQEAGLQRGKCVINDDMEEILTTLEGADAIVLGAPVNFGDVNALTRTFLERMVGFAFWPWEHPGAPRLRNRTLSKKAVLVTSSSAPGLLTKLFARSLKTLKTMAKLLGAKPVGVLVVGLVNEPEVHIRDRTRRTAQRLGMKLVARSESAT